MGNGVAIHSFSRWDRPTLEERADIAEKYGADDLYYCKDSWALRHYWTNRNSGEMQRARCNRWECPYCGPRKVDLWRQLVKQAEPTLFLTLTKAGNTLEEAARALTVFIRALRRGSKGNGINRKGRREEYRVEYFAVLEEHEDFERNGFHWHVLIKGVDHIPYKEVIKPLWMSATHYKPPTEEHEGQGSEIGWIERIRNNRAIGYVTKYLTKGLTLTQKGTKEVKRERLVGSKDEQGIIHLEKQEVTGEVASKAHRIRYSRGFFPESVAALRMRLFAGLEQAEEQLQESEPLELCEGNEGQVEGSSWILVERPGMTSEDIEHYKKERYTELTEDLEDFRVKGASTYEQWKREVVLLVQDEVRVMLATEYKRVRRKVLLEALEEGRRLSRRVIHTWHYQRQRLRFAG